MQTKNKSIAALVCGILGLVGGWIPVVCYFTLVLSIVAIVLGAKAQKQAKALGEPTGMATGGLVTGIIGVVLAVLSIVCVACAAGIAAAGANGLFQ
ncbi:MAG: DUF4190 domain-containing protein [Ruminococcaceae bacterium]|nr:DUF4190 domain-containing protein [Oscillospiraceae bacterium]